MNQTPDPGATGRDVVLVLQNYGDQRTRIGRTFPAPLHVLPSESGLEKLSEIYGPVVRDPIIRGQGIGQYEGVHTWSVS